MCLGSFDNSDIFISEQNRGLYKYHHLKVIHKLGPVMWAEWRSGCEVKVSNQCDSWLSLRVLQLKKVARPYIKQWVWIYVMQEVNLVRMEISINDFHFTAALQDEKHFSKYT